MDEYVYLHTYDDIYIYISIYYTIMYILDTCFHGCANPKKMGGDPLFDGAVDVILMDEFTAISWDIPGMVNIQTAIENGPVEIVDLPITLW